MPGRTDTIRSSVTPKYRPEEVIDGDVAYYQGGIKALLGQRELR